MISKETKEKCYQSWLDVKINTSDVPTFIAGMGAAEKILAPLIELLVDAVESVAVSGERKQETKEFWLQRTHEECAVVIVNDTTLARETLYKLAELREKKC